MAIPISNSYSAISLIIMYLVHANAYAILSIEICINVVYAKKLQWKIKQKEKVMTFFYLHPLFIFQGLLDSKQKPEISENNFCIHMKVLSRFMTDN